MGNKKKIDEVKIIKDDDYELWKRRACQIAMDFCSTIRSCQECGNPVIQGYCCTFCDSVNP